MLNQRKWIFPIKILSSLILILLVSCSVIDTQQSTNLNITSIKPRKYVNETLYFEDAWSTPNIFLDFLQGAGSEQFSIFNDSLYAIVSTKPYEKPSLLEFNLLTGDITEHPNPSRSILPRIMTTISSNSNFIYIGLSSNQKIGSEEQMKGAAKIIGFDPTINEVVWECTVPGVSSINTMTISEETIGVDGNLLYYFYIDADNGQLLQQEEKEIGYIMSVQNGLTFKRKDLFTLQAINSNTKSIEWETSLNNDYISFAPSFEEHGIIVQTGLDSIFSLNPSTGEILWGHENVISNTATDGTNVYFLTDEAKLLAIDIETGVISGEVQFLPKSIAHIQNRVFRVTASEDYLVVYFGDSNELFAFQINP